MERQSNQPHDANYIANSEKIKKNKNMHSFLLMESSPSSDPQDNIPVIEDISKDGEDGYISQGEALSCHVTISHL